MYPHGTCGRAILLDYYLVFVEPTELDGSSFCIAITKEPFSTEEKEVFAYTWLLNAFETESEGYCPEASSFDEESSAVAFNPIVA